MGSRNLILDLGAIVIKNFITVLRADGEMVHQQNGLGTDLAAETVEFVASL